MAIPDSIDLAKVFVADPAPVTWLVILPVVLCLLTGAVLAMIRGNIRIHAPIAIAALCLLVVFDAMLLASVLSDGPMTMVMGRWLPPFGIAFTVDVLGALLALVAGLLALAGAVYALSDIDTNRRRYGFYPFLMFLMAGVSGAFLTGDVFNLYVWFEVLLISSFGLIVLGGEREQIDGAMKYGLLNLVATTLFLIAIGYLYSITGTLNMADVATKIVSQRAELPLMTLATLFMVAFGMKAAAFPVNFWLPASYHTPRTAISALFAGLLTKVGIYALFRLMVMLMPVELERLAPLTGVVAILTMLTGALGAMAQTDLRRVLGYWVISGIGILLAGLALGGAQAITAAVLYMIHSMLVMAALYFLAGLVARKDGSFGFDQAGGLWRTAPLLSAAALCLLLSVAGLPPFSGFWPKAALVSAALERSNWWIAGAILLSGFLITFVAGRIFLVAFWRPAAGGVQEAMAHRHLPASALATLLLLTLASTLIGLWPEPVMQVAGRAASGLLEPAAYIRSVMEVSPP